MIKKYIAIFSVIILSFSNVQVKADLQPSVSDEQHIISSNSNRLDTLPIYYRGL